jgi:hypothetical protein
VVSQVDDNLFIYIYHGGKIVRQLYGQASYPLSWSPHTLLSLFLFVVVVVVVFFFILGHYQQPMS